MLDVGVGIRQADDMATAYQTQITHTDRSAHTVHYALGQARRYLVEALGTDGDLMTDDEYHAIEAEIHRLADLMGDMKS